MRPHRDPTDAEPVGGRPVDCASCGRPLTGRYCTFCGEEDLRDRSYSLRALLGHALESLINLDGRFLHSFRSLITSPGRLPVDFLGGRRKPYMGPVQTFLVANLIYFIVQPFSVFSPFTTPLAVQMTAFSWSDIASSLVEMRITELDLTLAEYTARFDTAAHQQGKALIVIMVPVFSLGVWALFGNARRYYAEHLVFSFYLFAWLLLWTGAETVLSTWVMEVLGRAGVRAGGDTVEIVSSAFFMVPAVVYMFFAGRSVYAQHASAVWIKVILLALWYYVVLSAYRLVLFWTTFWAV